MSDNPFQKPDGSFPSLHDDQVRAMIRQHVDSVPLGPISPDWVRDNVAHLVAALTSQPGFDPSNPAHWGLFAFGLDLGIQAGNREGFKLLMLKTMGAVLARMDDALALDADGFDWDNADWGKA